ncbi:MAG: M48 family metallopeptidase [Taibaiella sp.]|nr:M48 family metallopeptidase [Taibaiella sp.]
MKAIIQLSVLLLLFGGAWFGLSRIDFVERFRLYDISNKTEQKIGDAIVKTIKQTEHMIADDSTTAVITKITNKLLFANRNIPHATIIHLVKSKEINAFALPGNHIIVYTGLIEHCDSAQELCGVLAHEMAHIELRHVMKRLAGEVGIAVLASATTGNSQVINGILKTLSSTAFERSQESAADEAAVKYLVHAQINPAGFAGFMHKIDTLIAQPEIMEWISTHPNSKARAEAINQLTANIRQTYMPVVDFADWKLLKRAAGQ